MNDIAMWVGEESYPWPIDFIEEAKKVGVSKQIPKSAIPEIEPGKTRLVLIHPRALVTVNAPEMNLVDLGIELENRIIGHFEEMDKARVYVLERIIDSETGQNLPLLTEWLKVAELDGCLKEVEEKYKIEYHPGFIGYTFITGMHYVVGEDEDDLPPELAGRDIEAVRVVYEDE